MGAFASSGEDEAFERVRRGRIRDQEVTVTFVSGVQWSRENGGERANHI